MRSLKWRSLRSSQIDPNTQKRTKKQKSILNWKNIWKLVSISIEQKSKLWQQRSGSWTDFYFHYQVHFHVHVQLIARPNMKTNDQNICIRWSIFPFRPVLTNFNPVAWLSSIKMILIMTKKKFNVGKKKQKSRLFFGSSTIFVGLRAWIALTSRVVSCLVLVVATWEFTDNFGLYKLCLVLCTCTILSQMEILKLVCTFFYVFFLEFIDNYKIILWNTLSLT